MTTIEAPVETTVQPVTRRDVLHRAADLLEEFGWCQGTYGSVEDGALCAEGAIFQAARDLGVPPGMAYQALPGIPHTPTWNDQIHRTKAQVVARLRAAANASQ